MLNLAGLPAQGIHVSYGYRRLPSPKHVIKGGMVKFQRLSQHYANKYWRFNLLYLVSSALPVYTEDVHAAARRKGAKFVWNQNGVAYPAWMPEGWKELNCRTAKYLMDADYVFYQSKFAKSCADLFLGKRQNNCEILYNAVDTNTFSPPAAKNKKQLPILLLAGSQYHTYSLESAVRTLARIRKKLPSARLLVAGKVWPNVLNHVEPLIRELHLDDSIEILSQFSQTEAVHIYRRCDLLLHTKIQDVCPGVVIEAMACGLPVVYSLSGGVTELVGKSGGVGVPTTANWEKRSSPEPKRWAEAVFTLLDNYFLHAEAARQRAVENFDLCPWIDRHKHVFERLLT
jgi:glycosyltransferase involved in cell wall biosynthesis